MVRRASAVSHPALCSVTASGRTRRSARETEPNPRGFKMSNHAAIPAAPPCVFFKSGLPAVPNATQDHSGRYSPSSSIEHRPAKRAALSADFIGQERDESFVPACVSRSVSRVLFGHCFRACPAPGGSSLFCFGCATLRVTVSLQILFGKYAEKISPDPP